MRGNENECIPFSSFLLIPNSRPLTFPRKQGDEMTRIIWDVIRDKVTRKHH